MKNAILGSLALYALMSCSEHDSDGGRTHIGTFRDLDSTTRVETGTIGRAAPINTAIGAGDSGHLSRREQSAAHIESIQEAKKVDPRLAFELYMGRRFEIKHGQRLSLLKSVIREMAVKDCELVEEWIANELAGVERHVAIEALIDERSKTDLKGAIEYWESLEAGEGKTRAVGNLVEEFARMNIKDSLEWIPSIPNPSDRAAAIAEFGEIFGRLNLYEPWRLYRSVQDPELKEAMARSLVLNYEEFGSALEAMDSLGRIQTESIEEKFFNKWMNKSPQKVWNLFEKGDPNGSVDDLTPSLVGVLATDNAKRTANLIVSNGQDDNFEKNLNVALTHWLRTDPLSVSEWIVKSRSERTQLAATRILISYLEELGEEREIISQWKKYEDKLQSKPFN